MKLRCSSIVDDKKGRKRDIKKQITNISSIQHLPLINTASNTIDMK